VFENRVLRKVFGSKKEEVKENWKKLHKENFKNCNLQQMFLEFSHQGGGVWRDMW
jgi:hypothetical protein